MLLEKRIYSTLLLLSLCTRALSFQSQSCRGSYTSFPSQICQPALLLSSSSSNVLRTPRVSRKLYRNYKLDGSISGFALPLSLSSLSLQILPDNQWALYAVIATSAAAALKLEKNTKIGKSLSGPVTAMLISAILTNIGILPSEGSIHLINLQMFVLKLATPLLLFGADLKKIFRETGIMLKAFLLGTFGTLLGSFLGMLFLSGPLNNIGISGDGWKIASALTAKNIGGTYWKYCTLLI